MSAARLEESAFVAALGRPERVFDTSFAVRQLRRERVLVAGAAGMIGSALVAELRSAGVEVLATDVAPTSGPEMCVRMDVTRFSDVLEVAGFWRPTLVVNAAAQKLAVLGEVNPWQTINTSVNGVQNLLSLGVRLLHMSTCKAADPEVAYGIGKAAAEKLALDGGGTVVRFYNIVEAGPSVYDVWASVDPSQPLPVTPCTRHAISLREAVASVIVATGLPAGRYAVDPGEPVSMADYARRLFPARAQVKIPPRRGDRLHEPLHAACEHVEPSPVVGLNRIVSQHDAA